jgi:NH3-dependent NAD+ synthetase
MKEITDYGKVFETLIEKTEEYVLGNNLHAMVLGISGGIDSTVVAAICHEVSKRTNIPLIGRSLPTKFNKENEISAANLVGKAFCTDYKEVSIQEWYINSWSFNEHGSEYNAVANGNIQASQSAVSVGDIFNDYASDLTNLSTALTSNNAGLKETKAQLNDLES